MKRYATINAETHHVDLATGTVTPGSTITVQNTTQFLTEFGTLADTSHWRTVTFARPPHNAEDIQKQLARYEHARHELDWDAETIEADKLITLLIEALGATSKTAHEVHDEQYIEALGEVMIGLGIGFDEQ